MLMLLPSITPILTLSFETMNLPRHFTNELVNALFIDLFGFLSFKLIPFPLICVLFIIKQCFVGLYVRILAFLSKKHRNNKKKEK